MNKQEYVLREGAHPRLEGSQTVYKFPNGYGASVITGELFYTDADHPYEVAVLKFRDGTDAFDLCYTTPITDDVIGRLNAQELYDVLEQIFAL